METYALYIILGGVYIASLVLAHTTGKKLGNYETRVELLTNWINDKNGTIVKLDNVARNASKKGF